MWLPTLGIYFALLQTSVSLIENDWDSFCENIKRDSHSRYLPERMPRLEAPSRFLRSLRAARNGNDDIYLIDSDEVDNRLSSSELERRCDPDSFLAELDNTRLLRAPTCTKVCQQCFPFSTPLCIQRQPRLSYMKTCLCTYDAEQPVRGAVFSYRHDKRLMLRGVRG